MMMTEISAPMTYPVKSVSGKFQTPSVRPDYLERMKPLNCTRRGPTVITGYHNSPEKNAASYDSDGFYHTGDIAVCDSKTKKWYIVDRKKELIKVRGFPVAPAELEGILMAHPQIIDAAVIGVVREENGSELPRAYIVRRPGEEGKKLGEEEVKELIKGKLSSYKRLDGGVVFTNAIPRNASGKVLKRILRDIAAVELGADKPKL